MGRWTDLATSPFLDPTASGGTTLYKYTLSNSRQPRWKQSLSALSGGTDSEGWRMFDMLYEWFWWDRIWLPVNLTWIDLEDREGRVYAKASHLYVTIPCAFAFLLIRYLFESWIATPLAVSAGIKQRVHLKAETHPILELYYTAKCRYPAQVKH
ncbi:ceramide synthase 2-like isoform X2 [Thunnus maccoyii]|uniref:ceramide synthase 2-like isoform X2 n=1 Tax=Thunnus maccoyii TaxID=8240 RepID=UPI001C4C66ED|nr:ceramide synthase 2-like isoform X2 [Thunnus maccoyii]